MNLFHRVKTEDILKEINVQIASNPEIYFENTCNLVLETFNPNFEYT